MARSGIGTPSMVWMRFASSIIEIVTVAADIDDLAAGLRTLERPDECLDRVADVRERACLKPVAVDLHRLAVEDRLRERDDGPATS